MQITSDRGRRAALANLVAWQEPGGYQLPADVLHSVAVLHAAQALTVADPPPLRHIEAVAALAVDLLERGEPVDPVELSAQAATVRELAAHLDDARRLVTLAVENAGLRAVAVATDASSRIVGEVLQPAYADVLAQARALAPALHGHDLESGGWNASKKVAEARNTLIALADRHQALRLARRVCISLSGPPVEHDTADQFALLREPQALVPGYVPNRPLPRPDVPKDPAAGLLWLVTAGEPGRPWLPTAAQQDEAWMALFGEVVRRNQAAALSARAYAGQNV